MPSPVHPYSDYGVALRTLRSGRSWLNVMLTCCLIAQFVGFALMWWTPQPYEGMKGRWRGWISPTSQIARTQPAEPVFAGTPETRHLNVRDQWAMAFTIAVPITQIASILAVCSQTIIIFVALLVVLVAQAPGVAQITRSLIWSVLVLFMFLPWQYFARDFPNPGDFPIPGVIYSYTEMLQRIGPHVVGDKVFPFDTWMVYGRFIVWPLLGALAMVVTGERFRAGIMIAIGHPLQSMLQPRTAQPMPMPGPGPRPLVPAKIRPH